MAESQDVLAVSLIQRILYKAVVLIVENPYNQNLHSFVTSALHRVYKLLSMDRKRNSRNKKSNKECLKKKLLRRYENENIRTGQRSSSSCVICHEFIGLLKPSYMPRSPCECDTTVCIGCLITIGRMLRVKDVRREKRLLSCPACKRPSPREIPFLRVRRDEVFFGETNFKWGYSGCEPVMLINSKVKIENALRDGITPLTRNNRIFLYFIMCGIPNVDGEARNI